MASLRRAASAPELGFGLSVVGLKAPAAPASGVWTANVPVPASVLTAPVAMSTTRSDVVSAT